MTNNEIWKDIKNYEGLYQVSNLGNVRSLDRLMSTLTGDRLYKGKQLKPKLLQTGYLQVSLYKNNDNNGRHYQPLVHQLVALSFLNNENNYKSINHIDGNKQNNNSSNLEYCTYSYNELHKYRILNKKRGVYYDSKRNEYYAQLRYKGNIINLGRFKDKEEAYEAFRIKYLELYKQEAWLLQE